MKSIEWIDRLIEEKSLPSDRQASLLLGMSATTMSGHRNGRLVTLDDKYAYRLEEELALPHGRIVADQHAERAGDPNIAAMWRKLATVAASVLLLFFQLSFAPNPVEAANIFPNKNNDILYIMRIKLNRIRLAILYSLTMLRFRCTGAVMNGF